MNKHNIHEYWHLLEAMKAGKDIECKGSVIDNPFFTSPASLYRVKPDPLVGYINIYEEGGSVHLYSDGDEAVGVGEMNPSYIKTIKMVEEV